MIVVVEPGVAIKWFVEEPLRPQARSLLVHRHELIAPDILIAGVAELAWKKAASGEIAPDQMFAFRPWTDRKSPYTPVDGLYLAGASAAAAPLGGCVAGAVAAQAVIADLAAGRLP